MATLELSIMDGVDAKALIDDKVWLQYDIITAQAVKRCNTNADDHSSAKKLRTANKKKRKS